MLPILRLLTTVLSRGGEPEKQPWEKGNSFLISASIADLVFNVTPINYRTGHNIENLVASITDLSFVVTKVGANPL